jgi:hypothetical protein
LESKEAVKIWHEGTIGIPTGDTYTVAHYLVKAYDKPSENYGINGGKISKLSIKIDGKFTATYDRGWDIEPADDDEVTQIAYCILLMDYN